MKLVMTATERPHTVKFRALWVVGVFLAGTAVALAHSTQWAWTESKAEQMVMRNATVRFPPLGRASLENELRASAAYYRALGLAFEYEHRDGAAGEASAITYRNLAHRYLRALGKVRSGLEIGTADCKGSRPATARNRFKHFRCPVMSEVLEIPSAVIVPSENGELPTVVEGQPRRLGPYQAHLQVHVTGKSTIAYRQVG